MLHSLRRTSLGAGPFHAPNSAGYTDDLDTGFDGHPHNQLGSAQTFEVCVAYVEKVD